VAPAVLGTPRGPDHWEGAENAEVTKLLAGTLWGVDLEKGLELLSDPSLLLDRADLLAEVSLEGL
jgi:hypothetical protein